MSAIVKSLSDLVASILGVITSLFTTAGQLVQKTIQFALASVNEILSLVANFLKGVFNLGGDLASFIAGNLIVFMVIGLAFFGFLMFQRQQGNTVKVGNKKLN